MQTVQLALRDSEQAHSLRELLTEDGIHQVHLVKHPNMAMAGVIVMDVENIELLRVPASGLDRLVIMASKNAAHLTKLWEAGVRHVVFYGDPPWTVRVSVLATELMTSLSSSLSMEACDRQTSYSRRPIAFLGSTRPNRCRVHKARPKR
jgi:hypothetical protein